MLLENHHNAISSKPIDLVLIETATVHERGRREGRERARELERARESSSTTILLGNHHNASSTPIDRVPIEQLLYSESKRQSDRNSYCTARASTRAIERASGWQGLQAAGERLSERKRGRERACVCVCVCACVYV